MNAAMKVAKGTTPLANLTNDPVLKSAGDYCEANPGSNLANVVNATNGMPRCRGSTRIPRPRRKTRRTVAAASDTTLDRAPKDRPPLDRR